ncbi:MAG: GNAT family N-acetyltransferase [Acholeplasma sp.]|nr:GNAT family N-acetyltransferase [Acholeplasma sp.]
MKVYIFTEGGINIGYGHITRCNALCSELIKKNVEVDLVVDGSISDIDYISKVNIINKNWLDLNYLKKSITDNDYVIIDSYKATKEIYDLIAKRAKKVLYVDDIYRLDYPEGVIVNPSLLSDTIKYSQLKHNLILSGPEYIILREPFRNISTKEINKHISRVLITLGATDIRDLTSVILDNIAIKHSDIVFDVILSEDKFSNFKSSNNNNIVFHTNVTANTMCEIMCRVDFAITAAGQTIYELIATETPFIAIQVIENQKENIVALNKLISQNITIKYDESNFINTLSLMFEELTKLNNRKNIHDTIKYSIDGLGSKRIIEYLLEDEVVVKSIKIRHANLDDMNDVYILSNDKLVRMYSINKAKINWEEHVKWFNYVISDPNIVFYIIENQNANFLGQIRYSITGSTSIISISLSWKIRGRGFSKTILEKSINKLFSEREFVKEIVAYVSTENKASITIFKDLNFIEIERDNNLIKYQLNRGE